MFVSMQRQEQLETEEALREFSRTFDLDPEVTSQLRALVEKEIREIAILDSPPTVTAHGQDAGMGWYTGVQDVDEYWPRLKEKLESGSLRAVISEIDGASTKVVSMLANPTGPPTKRKGLVLGYVQSGKTANYTAVMAKAADAGYRFFIILSGLYENLRQQTQARLIDDLGAGHWHAWTSIDEDFTNRTGGTAVLRKKSNKSLAVVKKNADRLRHLLNWLREIPVDDRKRIPILLIDDEADQATPSTARELEERRGINKLVIDILNEIQLGTYVGYTATPFANIFIDPDDNEDLFPADFVTNLPRPDAYFGAEKIFGREPLDETDDADDGLDIVRDIPDAEELKIPRGEDARLAFDPPLPKSLKDAITWFLVATAIRRARGQMKDHSSMMVHTTHYVDPHFKMQARIDEFLDELREHRENGDYKVFEDSYNKEAQRAHEATDQPLPAWSEIAPFVSRVLSEVRVVVDNGQSEDRLDYTRKSGNNYKPETVIAVGGATLSRGLTLEGLVVSYFLRTSNTYDTLLQMGRWFGYRPGYEDLPRIWMQKSLHIEFKFLALVEEEIRREIQYLEETGITPHQLGVKVRAHPGRLQIVSQNKMGAATRARISFSGQRLQTFVFDELNTVRPGGQLGMLEHNLRETQNFVRQLAMDFNVRNPHGVTRWVIADVPSRRVISYLTKYLFHEKQKNFDPEAMIRWIENEASDRSWNIVVMGKTPGRNETAPLIDLGLDTKVHTFSRAPIERLSEGGTVDIKALMSHADWFADLDGEKVRALAETDKKVPRKVRKKLADGRGALLIYGIDKDSAPKGSSDRNHVSRDRRRQLRAPEHIVGLGMIFPDIDRENFAESGTYFSVRERPDLDPRYDESEE